jgi:uncharacterized protein (TIGR03435 family)
MPPSRRFVPTLATLIVIAGTALLAGSQSQTPPAEPSLEFEVASIRRNTSGDFRKSVGPSPGGFSALNVTLRDLLPLAYGVPQAMAGIRIVGGPAWADRERFDIEARTNGRQPAARIGQMLRALLAERFQLKAHSETRELSVYALVVENADGRFGPHLKAASYDCAARYAALARMETPLPLPVPAADGRQACSGRVRPGDLYAIGFDMDWLTATLSPLVSRVVLNRTGLNGGYDFTLEWTPEQAPTPRPGEPELRIDPNGPSIFTALREQLGLRLDQQRAPVDVIVIDEAHYPTPN